MPYTCYYLGVHEENQVPFTYAEAEILLARLYKADEAAQRGAFRGRLKHLQRLGIPMGSRPGKGKKVSYDRQQIYQWAFCLELEEFGIDPTVIVRIVEREWEKNILPQFITAERNEREWFLFTAPRFMSAGWDPWDASDFSLFLACTIDDLNAFVDLSAKTGRGLILSVTRIVRAAQQGEKQ
jgi:hypothetical protein